MTHHEYMVEAMIHFWVLREEAAKQKAKAQAEKDKIEAPERSSKAA